MSLPAALHAERTFAYGWSEFHQTYSMNSPHLLVQEAGFYDILHSFLLTKLTVLFVHFSPLTLAF